MYFEAKKLKIPKTAKFSRFFFAKQIFIKATSLGSKVADYYTNKFVLDVLKLEHRRAVFGSTAAERTRRHARRTKSLHKGCCKTNYLVFRANILFLFHNLVLSLFNSLIH